MTAFLLTLAMLYFVSSASSAQQGQQHQRHAEDVKSEVGASNGFPSEMLYKTVLSVKNIDHRVLNLAPFASIQDAYAALRSKQDIDHDIEFQPDGGNLFSSIESELGKPKSKSDKPASKSVKGAKKVSLKPTPNPTTFVTPNPVPIPTPVTTPFPTPCEALLFFFDGNACTNAMSIPDAVSFNSVVTCCNVNFGSGSLQSGICNFEDVCNTIIPTPAPMDFSPPPLSLPVQGRRHLL